MCEWKYKIKGSTVRHLDWWVEYVDEVSFKSDNRCDLHCDETKQKVCELLGAFENFKIQKENEREERIRIKVANKMKTQEEIKLKKCGLPNKTRHIQIIELIDDAPLEETNQKDEDNEMDLYSHQEAFMLNDKITRRENSRKRKRIWDINNWKGVTTQ